MSGAADHTNLTATGTESGAPSDRAPAALVLTVLCHPDPARIGEQAIEPWRIGAELVLSRATPAFARAADPRPLDDRGVSRRPLRLHIRADGLGASSAAPLAYTFAGQPLGREALLPLPALLAGRPLRCGRRVLLWVEARAATPAADPARGRGPLAGPSAQAHALRARVALLAPHRFPVMVCGAPDTGRAAVARALHDEGPWAENPFVVADPAADAAALDDALARARGGTLLIPQVEALPPAAQHRLARWLATDDAAALRVVSTAAVDLEGRATAGRFDAPLAYRLRSAHIDAPPLRARPADLARLFVDALRDRLRTLGLPDPLAAPREHPWLRPALVEALIAHTWPGNLRELHNLALDVALGAHDAPEAALPPGWPPAAADARPAPRTPQPAAGSPADPTPPAALDDRAWAVPPDVLRAALARQAWRVRQTAEELGIARNTVYAMMGRLGIRRPGDLGVADIQAAIEAEGSTDLERIARRLQVSTHGLRVRAAALGLGLG